MAADPDPTEHPTLRIAVIGAGSAGERIADLLAGRGHRVTLIERRLVGGECPYFACIPSKAMLTSASVRAAAAGAHAVSAVASPLVVQDGAEAFTLAAARRDEAADHHDDAGHVSALADGVRLVRGDATVIAEDALEVVGDEGTEQVTFDHLVIATGSAPVIPDIPGLADADPWTFEEAWTAVERPTSLLVIGAGPVGCEIAQAYARFGCRVTLVDSAAVLGGTEEPEITADLRAVLEDDHVAVHEDAEVTAVAPGPTGGWVVTVDGREVAVERIVVAVGMTPRLDGLGLDVLGIDAEELAVDAHCRVEGTDHVWAIGDVTELAPFTHTANHHAALAAAAIDGAPQEGGRPPMPRAVYTSPEMAAVGLTRSGAADAGVDVASIAFDLADTARGAVDHARAGHLVLVADRRDRTLVGASLVAPSAAESISEFALAIMMGATVDVLARLVHPFPSWSEGFGPALQQLRSELAYSPPTG